MHNVNGRVDTAIGCVDTGTAEISIVVAGDPAVVAILVDERLPEDDEGLRDTLDNIAEEHRSRAGANLDGDAANGLIRLLAQAAHVQAQAISATNMAATGAEPSDATVTGGATYGGGDSSGSDGGSSSGGGGG